MARIGDELRDVWTMSDGKVTAEGDAHVISDWLANKLDKIRIDSEAGAWLILYRHKETGQFWELTYPQSEMHGGGPRLLRCLGDDASELGRKE
jgi:hypothetical protein